MPAGICTRVPNSGTSKLCHARGAPICCGACAGRAKFSLGAKATLFSRSLPFFGFAAGVGGVGVDLGGTSGLGCVATMIPAPPELAGGEDSIGGCEDVSLRPKPSWTFCASVPTGSSLVLTLAREGGISARRGKSENGLKPRTQIHRADAVKTVATKMMGLLFLLLRVGTATSDCLNPSTTPFGNGSALGTTPTARIQSRSSWFSALAISSSTMGGLARGHRSRSLVPSKSPSDFPVSQSGAA